MDLWQMGEPSPTVRQNRAQVVDIVRRIVRRRFEPDPSGFRMSLRSRRAKVARDVEPLSARAGTTAAVVAIVGFALAGVSGAPAGAATTHSVSVVDFSFSPRSLTVQAGDTVVWTNNGSVDHTVTADDGSFDSGSIAPGESFSHTFPSTRVVPYHCKFHGAAGGIGMAGTITVQGAPSGTTAPPATSPRTSPPPPPAPGGPAAPGQSTTGPGQTAAVPGAGPGASNPVAGTAAVANHAQLAHTGSRTAGLVVAAAVFFLAGAAVVLTTRRRSGLGPDA
jgi:plastocyanin